MADVTITYKGANIATMDATGSKTLQTAGTYCEGDIGVEYVKPGGGGPISVPAKEVNFRDYDGTVVYSYTPAEFAALTAMPANPDHSGDEIPLTSQGWNWSFADAQAYVAKYGRLEVGQMYITTDGKTHIKIYIDPDTPANRMTFYLRWTQSVSNGVTVDWGDGSATQTYSGTSAANHDHTYTAGGWYDITLTVTSGTVSFVGDSSNRIYGSSATANTYNRSRIIEIYFGQGLAAGGIGDYLAYLCYGLSIVTLPSGVTSIGAYAFSYVEGLSSITVPHGVTSINNRAFNTDYGLSSVSIPNSVTGVGAYAFTYCNALIKATLPDSVRSIGESAFQGCNSLAFVNVSDDLNGLIKYSFSGCNNLTSITIPESVVSIEGYTFSNNYGMGEYHFNRATPPLLANTNAFNNIPSDCVIYVPRGSLNSYKTATNWSTYASHMQEEPQ